VESHEIAVCGGGGVLKFPDPPRSTLTILICRRSGIILLDRQRELANQRPQSRNLIHLARPCEAEVTDAVHRKRFGWTRFRPKPATCVCVWSSEGTSTRSPGERFDDTAIAIPVTDGSSDWACSAQHRPTAGACRPSLGCKLNELMIRNNAYPNERVVTLTRANRSEGVPPKSACVSAQTSVPRRSAADSPDRIKDAQTMRVVFPRHPVGRKYEH